MLLIEYSCEQETLSFLFLHQDRKIFNHLTSPFCHANGEQDSTVTVAAKVLPRRWRGGAILLQGPHRNYGKALAGKINPRSSRSPPTKIKGICPSPCRGRRQRRQCTFIQKPTSQARTTCHKERRPARQSRGQRYNPTLPPSHRGRRQHRHGRGQRPGPSIRWHFHKTTQNQKTQTHKQRLGPGFWGVPLFKKGATDCYGTQSDNTLTTTSGC